VDGIGHPGGGIGVLLIAPYIDDMGALTSFIVISAFLVGPALVAQLGTPTRDRRLEEVSP
jgi:hypothetical protein